MNIHTKTVCILIILQLDEVSGGLRLVGGSFREGRLEIEHNGAWGTVCDDDFGSTSAMVACKQLGISPLSTAEVYTAGCSSDKILLDDVTCRGHESRLEYCPSKSWGEHNCGHSEDVGIRCIANGNWGSWNSWGTCSVTCGNGYQQRLRYCNNPSPSPRGSYCAGNAFEIQSCVNTICSVNGIWASWNTWGVCSVSCGSGYQHRNRQCNNPSPSGNGLYCEGSSFQLESCNSTHPNCSVNGNWGMWSSWGICNGSCFIGFQERTRMCDSPFPEFGGEDCIGSDSERNSCRTNHCIKMIQSTGLLIGVSVASMAVTIIILISVYCIRKRMKNGQRENISSHLQNRAETEGQRIQLNDYTKSGNSSQPEKSNELRVQKGRGNANPEVKSSSSAIYEEVNSAIYENHDDSQLVHSAGTSAYEAEEEYEYIEAKSHVK